MAKTNYHAEHKAVLDRLLLEIPGVTTGMVFGLPCYKVNETVFATLSGEGVGIRLPEARTKELLQRPGVVPFQPYGRSRGKEFIQINHQDSQGYLQERELFLESMMYVSSLSTSQKLDSLPSFEPGVSPTPQGLDPLHSDGQVVADEELHFRAIAETLAKENDSVTLGKMMSSPGIKYKDRVFAFYHYQAMTFRLGRNVTPEAFGVRNYSLLAPFKTRSPMMDWFQVASADRQRWEELARYALRLMVEQSQPHIPDTTTRKIR